MPKAETYFRDTQALAVAHAIEDEDLTSLGRFLQSMDPNHRYAQGMTLLNWAFAHQRLDSARLLLARGADPDLATAEVTPWELAMKMDDIRWVQLLVQAGADLNRKQHGTPVWFETFLAGNWKHLDYLVEQGVDLNATDAVGNTAVMELARLGQYGMVFKLLQQGADTAQVSGTGASLHTILENSIPPRGSVEFGNREKVRAWLEHQSRELH
ncbi:MAG: hypothetical protein ABW101_15240 [Candidatus Thiodiazotropha sp.]